jgi:hypothetical protein
VNDPKHEQVGAKHETVGEHIKDFMEGGHKEREAKERDAAAQRQQAMVNPTPVGQAPAPMPSNVPPVDAPLPARVPGLWYAVAAPVTDPNAAPDADRGLVWTLSRDPDAPGWETDKATAGYGMPRHVAESIVTILNAAAVFGAVVPDA